jgi:tetratricopeptide (TPR) repeat protein
VCDRTLTLLAVWLVLVAAPVSAQDAEAETPVDQGAAPENIEATRRARELFQQGMEHFEARRFREAIRSFNMASEQVPSADLWFNVARAHEELSEYEPAIEHYRRYLRDRVDPPDRESIEQHIAALTERAEAARQARRRAPTTGTLRVTTNREGADVSVDDRGVGEAPLAAPLTLPPGRHRLSVRRDGYMPFEAEVDVQAGVTTAAYADLQPATEYRSTRGGRLFTWIAGGLSVAALGTSIYFGAKAARRQNDMDYDGATDAAEVSDWLLGGAIVLAVGAVVLYFVEGSSVGTERVEPPSD